MPFLSFLPAARARAPDTAATAQALAALATGPHATTAVERHQAPGVDQNQAEQDQHQAQQDQHQALDLLYRREAGAVYRYALACCGNPAWAADATQDAFVALATRPQAFDPAAGALGAYLAGVARHALLARWREGRRDQPPAGADETDAADGAPLSATELAAAESPESLLVRAQGSAEVWAALRQLSPAFREAVVLVDLQERPYAEAARIAGVEINTLRTRLHRARLRLAAMLADRAGDHA